MITSPGRHSPRSRTKKRHMVLLLDGGVVDPKYQSVDLPANDQERLLWNIFAGGMNSRVYTTLTSCSSMDYDPEDLDFELHRYSRFDEGFKGLDNVRACCDGRHTLDHSEQHVTLNNRRSADNQHPDPNNIHENLRPASPAWSFRSRTRSKQSHEGVGIFSRTR